MVCGNLVTGIVHPHDMDGAAVLARPAETEALARVKVAAVRVDGVDVDDGELVTRGGGCVGAKNGEHSRRDVVCSRDVVANIAGLDGVGTGAVLCRDD